MNVLFLAFCLLAGCCKSEPKPHCFAEALLNTMEQNVHYDIYQDDNNVWFVLRKDNGVFEFYNHQYKRPK